MTFASLFFLIPAPLLAQAPAPASLVAMTVQSLVVHGNQLGIGLIQPCGTTQIGWIFHRDEPSSTLRVGALLRQDEVLCAGLPKRRVASITRLDLSSFRRVIPYNELNESSRQVHLARLDELHLVGQGDTYEAQGIATVHCGKIVGSALGMDSALTQLGIVETDDSGEGLSPCPTKSRVVKFPFIAVHRASKLAPLTSPTPDTPSVRDSFQLRLARPYALHRDAEGLKISVRRHCNEAPVGTVLGRWNPARPHEIGVGLLLARYDRLTCPSNLPRTGRLHWRTSRINLPRDLALVAITPPAAMPPLSIKVPTRFAARAVPARADAMSFQFLGGCQRALGTVYAADPSGALTVGILEAQTTSRSCLSPVREYTLTQPTIFANTTTGNLYPMEIQGNRVRL